MPGVAPTWIGWGGRVVALPNLQGVVVPAVVVCVEELLEPLDEFKVVLELALHKPLHRDDLVVRVVQEHGSRQIQRVFGPTKHCGLTVSLFMYV